MFKTDEEVRAYARSQGLTEHSTEVEIRQAFPDLPLESEIFGPDGRLRMIDGIPGFVSNKYRIR